MYLNRPQRSKTHHGACARSAQVAVGVFLVVLGFAGAFFSAPIKELSDLAYRIETGALVEAENVAQVSAPTARNASGVESGGGIVTCGKGADPCTIPDLLATIMRFGEFLIFKILTPLAALSIAISGIYILSGAATPGNIETGKKIIWDVVYGMAIALSAYVVVKLIFTTLGVAGVTFR